MNAALQIGPYIVSATRPNMLFTFYFDRQLAALLMELRSDEKPKYG